MRSYLKELRISLSPRAPFTDPTGDKGWLNHFTRAQPYRVTELALKIPGWSERKSPLKVAALSDIHLGSQANDANRLAEIVDAVNKWSPDIVLLIGDFMNTQPFGHGRFPPDTIAGLLQPLASRLGTYAVLGNHDWHYDGFAVWKALEQQGIAALENTSMKIADDFGDFWIVGLADHQTRQPDIDIAFAKLPDTEPALVMAHDPATFADVPSGPYLTLSGHTHGGQVRLPFIGPVVNSSEAPLRWSAGHIVEDGRNLFVSRGLGTSIFPIRLNCPPEICFLTVHG